MAAKDGVPERIVSETADLWFHCLVALTHFKLRPRTCWPSWRAAKVVRPGGKASRPKD